MHAPARPLLDRLVRLAVAIGRAPRMWRFSSLVTRLLPSALAVRCLAHTRFDHFRRSLNATPPAWFAPVLPYLSFEIIMQGSFAMAPKQQTRLLEYMLDTDWAPLVARTADSPLRRPLRRSGRRAHRQADTAGAEEERHGRGSDLVGGLHHRAGHAGPGHGPGPRGAAGEGQRGGSHPGQARAVLRRHRLAGGRARAGRGASGEVRGSVRHARRGRRDRVVAALLPHPVPQPPRRWTWRS